MTPPANQPLGDPVCGSCQYSLKGLADSARCPECGKPIVETLVRTGFQGFRGVRYRSPVTILGLPLVAVASGPTAEEKFGHARGIIAIGDLATGVIAIGAVARGGIAIGSLAIGGIAMGGIAIGLAAMGGIAAGLAVCGGVAVGGYAWGGVSIYGVRGFGGARVRMPWFW